MDGGVKDLFVFSVRTCIRTLHLPVPRFFRLATYFGVFVLCDLGILSSENRELHVSTRPKTSVVPFRLRPGSGGG